MGQSVRVEASLGALPLQTGQHLRRMYRAAGDEHRECAQCSRTMMRGQGHNRSQREDHADRAEDATTLEGGRMPPMASVRRPMPYPARDVADDRRREDAVVTRVSGVEDADQDGAVAEELYATSPQIVAVFTGGEE